MSRFTFTLALAMIAVFAFGQRATKRATFAQQTVKDRAELKRVAPENDKSINLNVLFDEDFNTYNENNTNGAPDGWQVYSDIANQDSLNMFRSLVATHPSEIGAPWAGAPTDRDEFLISPEIPVNATHPALWIEQRISYYWFVEQQSDDFWISVSNDDFATETVVFDEDDQASVEAAGMPWPYVSFDPYTAKIDLSAWAGQNIKVKFHTKSVGSADGTKGVSYYLSRVRSVETPQYDVATSGNYIGSWYEFGKYSIMPWDEVRGFTEMEAWATNYGYDDLTGLKLTATIDNGSTPIMSIDTTLLSGALDLPANAPLDTFRMVDYAAWIDSNTFNLFTLQAGEYTYKQEITCNEGDDNPDDNSWSFPISITNEPQNKVLCREFETDGVVKATNYVNGGSGDKFGVNFICMQGEDVMGMSVFVSNQTSVGTVLRGYLYNRDNNNEEIASTGLRDIEPSDLGNQVYLGFSSPVHVDSLTRYTSAVSLNFDPDSVLALESYSGYKNDLMYQMGAINSGADWYSGSGTIVKMLIHLTPDGITGTNEVAVNNNINVYPNPSTGLLHIDNLSENSTIKVYNMLGAEVASVNNASEFNTVDLSSYNAGTYLVKVFSNNNVIVKKVNLVK